MEVPEIIRNTDNVLRQMCTHYGYRASEAEKQFNISAADFGKIADILQSRGFSTTTNRSGELQLFATAEGRSFHTLNSFEKEWLRENEGKQVPAMNITEEDYLFLKVFPTDKHSIPKEPDVLEAVKQHGLLNNDVNRLFDRLCPRYLNRDRGGVTTFSINDTGLNAVNKYEKQAAENLEKAQQDKDVRRKELQKLELEIDNLVNKISDYDTTKKRARDSWLLGWLSAAIALIALLSQWLCNKAG